MQKRAAIALQNRKWHFLFDCYNFLGLVLPGGLEPLKQSIPCLFNLRRI